jgi:hypothetical protein
MPVEASTHIRRDAAEVEAEAERLELERAVEPGEPDRETTLDQLDLERRWAA